MRLNRGTIGLLAVLLLVIVAVLVINNQQASAPGDPTATPATVTGALLPNVAAENIVRYEIRDNTTGAFTVLTKDSGGAWVIDATNALPERSPEQSLIDTTAGQIVAINYNNTFEGDDLASFALDQPAYTVNVSTSDGQFYTIYVGAKVPTSARYYAVVQQSSVAPEAGTEDQATAEATSDDASKPVLRAQATEEATDEATAEATVEAEMTAEATAELTSEPASPIENPVVMLTGTQTIYVIPQTVVDTLKRWLTTPPYAPVPTPDPALALTPEVTAEITAQPTPLLEEGGDASLIPDGTPIATQEATEAS